ncbi:IS5 family transposase [Sphingobium sp. 3R8]|uniref:IS5 family transposase n=1 Tax=Sphingobium sp. 3R8 TaxID=2874921 RepID=UPI0021E22E53|nr:IS5 family transposase [Sphingobium sp. 3R8]
MEQRGFAEAFLPAGFGRNARLERIAAILDWGPIEVLVRRLRPGMSGRPPYRALAMVRALLLQQWYVLSDLGLEEALLDRVSFRRFCSLSLEEATPDETTLCRFRLALVEVGLGDALFAEVARQLDAGGYLVKSGTLIDASLVEAAVRRPADGSTPKGEESRSALDPDANWMRTARGTKRFFGYKFHIGIDQGSALICARAVTSAKTYESEVADT